VFAASIIIVTYNNAAHILPCLQAIQQETSLPIEIIVWDNDSQDGTADLISQHFPGVNLIHSQENVGFAAANNHAAVPAQADVLVFLNPDTLIQPGWLPPLLQTLAQHSEIGAVTPQLLFAQSPERINACGNSVYLSGVTYCLYLGRPSLTSDDLMAVGALSGAAFAMKKGLFAELGGFEESFFMYFEDTDLSLRLRQDGYGVTAVPTSRIYHDYEPKFSPQKVYYLERNRYLSIFSLCHWSLLVLMFPALLWTEMMMWGYCWLHGRAFAQAKARAWRDFFQRRGWIRQRRRQYANWQMARRLINQVFTSRLEIGYTTHLSALARPVEWVGWLMAAPILKLARLLTAVNADG
jgi:GT2 family glycosyltransferase